MKVFNWLLESLSLSGILDSIVAAILLAFTVWLLRKISSLIVRLRREWKEKSAIALVARHLMYKEFVYSKNIPDSLRANFDIFRDSLKSLIDCLILAIYYFGIRSLLSLNALGYIFSALMLWKALNARMWLEDMSSEKIIRRVSPELKEKAYSRLRK